MHDPRSAGAQAPAETSRAAPSRDVRPRPDEIECPSCGYPMHGVKGSRRAICPNCGFKDACCY